MVGSVQTITFCSLLLHPDIILRRARVFVTKMVVSPGAWRRARGERGRPETAGTCGSTIPARKYRVLVIVRKIYERAKMLWGCHSVGRLYAHRVPHDNKTNSEESSRFLLYQQG